eukprot:TRINITY_DN22738_c0_g1_i1.p1 TRINITY_DN22738_c0_g1~~TRINITY_DN22738_c0_g1_i1.p1  ORF type:complete len:766 (+),score=255.14 TRINITY_DN22738_c0_g1_i1:116-2299(+)
MVPSGLYYFWLVAPVITGLVLLVVWLAKGSPEPWMGGWEVALPCVGVMPVWAAVMAQMHAARQPNAKPKVRRWENFPGTVHAMTAVVVVVWSVCFVRPDRIGKLAKPRVLGEVPYASCRGGVLQKGLSANDVAELRFRDTRSGALAGNVSLYIRPHNCWDCEPQRLLQTRPGDVVTQFLDVAHGLDFVLAHHSNATAPVRKSTVLGDQGIYELTLAPGGDALSLRTVEHPWSSAAPILIALGVVLLLQVAHVLGNRAVDWLRSRAQEDADDELLGESRPVAAPGRPGQRLLALDVFRGLSLAVMNIANYGGMGYWWLDHTKWDGLSIADLVFPWFIWIMGVAMAIALEGSRVRSDRCAAVVHIIRRAAILFIAAMWLGGEYVANSALGFAGWRIPGVLQRFAISYLVCGAAIVLIPKPPPTTLKHLQDAEGPDCREDGSTDSDGALPHFCRWALPSLREAPLFLALAGVWLAVSLGGGVAASGVPPGQEYSCPRGYLGPGGVSQGASHFYCTGGIARHIDEKVFGPHKWHSCFPCELYKRFDVSTGRCETPPQHDPEGLLGSLNSILLCWLGVVVGRIVREGRDSSSASAHRRTAVTLLAFGGTLCLIAGVLCEFKQFGGFVPVNKNLWSTSFIGVMAGSGTIVLTFLLWVVDWGKWWSGKPFLFVGMNSILYYCMHEILENYPPLAAPDQPGGGTKQYQVIRVSVAVAVNMIVVYWLWRNKLFLKI